MERFERQKTTLIYLVSRFYVNWFTAAVLPTTLLCVTPLVVVISPSKFTVAVFIVAWAMVGAMILTMLFGWDDRAEKTARERFVLSSTSPWIIHQSAKTGYFHREKMALEHPNCSPKTLQMLATKNELLFARRLAAHPNTPEDVVWGILERLSVSRNETMMEALGRSNMSEAFAKKLSNLPLKHMELRVFLANPSVPANVLSRYVFELTNNADRSLREILMKNPNLPAKMRLLLTVGSNNEPAASGDGS